MSEIKERRARIEREHPGVYAQLLDADPHGGKAYAAWLANLFEEKKLLLEDLPKATTYLAIFHKYRNSLKRKTLAQYTDLPDLFHAVEPFMPKQAELADDASIRERPDIMTIYEHEGLSVRIPLTTAAAQYLGRGTQWCTSYTEKPSHFWNYAIQGPLLQITTPRMNGRPKQRYKLHFPTGQFHDTADKQINIDQLLSDYPALIPILAPFAEAVVQRNGEALAHIPKSLRSKKLCQIAVAQNGRALKYVPEKFRSKELCELAVKNNEWALEYLPKELHGDKIYQLATKHHGMALAHIGQSWRSYELCELAVQQDGLALRYVPEFLPALGRLYKLAVQQDGLALLYVPHRLRTKTLCETAVQQNGLALQFVPEAPENLRTKELCKLAVQQNGLALECVPVPKNLHDEDYKKLCKLAVQQSGGALEHVPYGFRTKELCEAAVQQNGGALLYVPKGLRGEDYKELRTLAVQQNGLALRHIHEDLRDQELGTLAVQQNGLALEHVPEGLRTEELCRLAVEEIAERLRKKTIAPNELNNFFHFIPNALQDRLVHEAGITCNREGFIEVAAAAPKTHAAATEIPNPRQLHAASIVGLTAPRPDLTLGA